MTQFRGAQRIRPNGTRHGTQPPKKSSYKYIRNRQGPRWPQGACHTGDLPSVPGAANSQTTRVLDDAVATDNAVDVLKHVGLCSCPQAHTGNPHPVTRGGGLNPAPAAKAHTKTTHPLLHTQDLFKGKSAAHEEGFIPRNPYWDKIIRTASRTFTPKFYPARDEVTLTKQGAWDIS